MSICKNVYPFALILRGAMRKATEDNKYCWMTPWFTLDVPGDKQFSPGISWEVGFLLQS